MPLWSLACQAPLGRAPRLTVASVRSEQSLQTRGSSQVDRAKPLQGAVPAELDRRDRPVITRTEVGHDKSDEGDLLQV